MYKNVLTVRGRYSNVLDLHNAYTVPRTHENVVDLRKKKEPPSEPFGKNLFKPAPQSGMYGKDRRREAGRSRDSGEDKGKSS